LPPDRSSFAPAALAATEAPLSRAKRAMPPAWSKWACELRISFTSRKRKPSARMFASICGTLPSSVPSISTWPCGEVIRIALNPCVPTYQLLP